MPPFVVYLRLGFEHLLDLQGYDHILFLAALCAGCSLARWRELLVLITAFTLGHSVSLALATLRLVRIDTGLVEFLIPVTIVATAATNLGGLRNDSARRQGGVRRQEPDLAEGRSGLPARVGASVGVSAPGASPLRARRARYAVALVFGVVHGLGFSSFLRLALGEERSLLVPLLSFNVGLEFAQIVAAGAILAVALVATRLLRLPETGWNALVSVAAGAVAAWMALGRWPG